MSRTAASKTSTKATMDPDRKATACLLTLLYAYGKPRLPPVHKYSSLRSSAHRAAGPLRWTIRTVPAVKVQCQVLNR